MIYFGLKVGVPTQPVSDTSTMTPSGPKHLAISTQDPEGTARF